MAVWLDRPSLDTIAAAVATALVIAVQTRINIDALDAMAFGDRLDLYTDAITITGIFLAFSGTGLAAYLALSGGNAEKLKRLAHRRILQQWVSCIAGTAVVLGVFVIIKMGERATGAAWTHALATFAVVLLSTKATRMIYVLAQLAGVAAAPVASRRRSERKPHLKKVG